MSSLKEIPNVQDVEAYKKLMESAERRNSKLKELDFQIELNEKRKAGLEALRPEKKPEEEQVEVLPPEPFFPLTEEEMNLVSSAFSVKNWRKILVSHQNSSIYIRGEVLQCLKPGAWLNDEVINLYLELLKERENREPKKFLKCHFFNTFFYKKLVNPDSGYNYKGVKRWTSRRKLGYCLWDCDKIFVPIHKDIHWCLAVINKKDQKFQYLDSLKGKDPYVLRALGKYFVEEVKDKSGENIDISSWEQEYVDDLPAQENGFDCGMFMLKYIDFYSRGLSLCFDQEHMSYFRLRTAKEILKLRAD
ncbi:Ubiquitin-like-specific protease 1A [Hibiscus syriacus]|uniref:Ubiquitin-like-specific protease 1A n=1 Tax=Hibiscus syriacus TaxID=106335 RepID=A0A6A3B7Y8_HIBSY|nr:Ubiquitin-like-specific protease 1A [Hibiscus syriacus]